MLPISLLLLLVIHLPSHVLAALGHVPLGSACNPANNALDPDTHRFITDCDPMTYCDPSDSICKAKGCRRDMYPFGYGATPYPPLCPDDQFCPDEEDACQPLLEVGSQCQLNRDDECAPPPNGQGFSLCLSFSCTYGNATLNSPCIVENTVYVAYAPDGAELPSIVSRDNCLTGGYCDGVAKQCMPVKDIGVACEADKECASYNCISTGVCDQPPGTPRQLAVWECVVTGLGVLIALTLTPLLLLLLHKRERRARQAEIQAYWREQTTMRDSIFRMHAEAEGGDARGGPMYQLAPQESSVWSRGSEDSNAGLMTRASPGGVGGWGGQRSADRSAERLSESWRPKA